MTDKLATAATTQPIMSDISTKSTVTSILPGRVSIVASAYPSNQTALPPIAVDKRFDISNLMSPPEATPFDNFNNSSIRSTQRTEAMLSVNAEGRQIPCPPPSPPISPYAKASNTNVQEQVPSPSADPILYPVADNASSPPALFGEEDTARAEIAVAPLASLTSITKPAPARASRESLAAARVVDEHIAARPVDFFRAVSPPKREDYELTLYFKSNVMKYFKANPRGWLRQERDLLRADKRDKKLYANHARPLLPAKPAPKQEVPRLGVRGGPSVRVTKPSPKVAVHSSVSPASNGRSIRVNVNPSPVAPSRPVMKHSSPTPEPRVRAVAPNREDKDFNSLPDHCPPIDSLPNKPHCLKVEWKGNALDLSTDPFRHLLHPEELALAASLRLDCATYLTSKRRIFVRRLECARIGKEFRKTDAQQACKIDVNKASKLWTAYDKVGWLNAEWMKRFN